MARIIKSYLDEDFFQARKVFIKLENKQKNYKKGPAYFTKVAKKNEYFSSGEQYKKNTQVVVKITGCDGTFDKLKSHIRYISRHGEVTVFTAYGEAINGRENLKQIWDSFNDCEYKIPSKKELETNAQKEQRETIHLVFSMKDYTNATNEQIAKAAMATIGSKYPDNYFVLASHNDTAHPHTHLVLKVRDTFGNRINPKKKDLDELRKNFVLELNKLGVDATTKIKRKYDKNGEEVNKNIITESDRNMWARNRANIHKPHHYKIVSYGRANYKFDETNEPSFYVRYRTSKGKDIDIWANDLERVVTTNNLKIGDYARLAITGEEAYQKKIYDKKTKSYYQKTVYKKTWDVSIEGKNEKIQKPLKKFTKSKYEVLKEPHIMVVEQNKQNENIADTAPKIISKARVIKPSEKTKKNNVEFD